MSAVTSSDTDRVLGYLLDRTLPTVSDEYQITARQAGQPDGVRHRLPRFRGQHEDELSRLSRLLAIGNGLGRQRFLTPEGTRALLPTGGAPVALPPGQVMTTLLRLVASGGAAYPVDLWVLAATGQRLPRGVHRYDPLHHALVQVRDVDPRPGLARALGGAAPALAVVLTTRLERTTARYGEFAHRLHLLDTGHTLAQLIVASRMQGWPADPRLAFVDDELEHLLDLGSDTEVAFALLALDTPQPVAPAAQPAPCRVPPVPDRYPHGVLLAGRRRAAGPEPPLGPIPMPATPGRAILRRRSPIGGFAAPAPQVEALAPVAAAVEAVLGPLGGRCVLVPPKDPRVQHRIGAPGSRFNLSLAGVLVPVLDLPELVRTTGPTGLRTGAIAIGAALQAASLVAADRGLATYPVCAYDAQTIEDSLGLPESSTMCVAPVGHPTRIGVDMELPL